MSKVKLVISIIVVVGIMLTIYMLSAMPASKSCKASGEIIASVMGRVASITNSDIDANEVANKLNPIFRESMHAVEYFALSMTLLVFLNIIKCKNNSKYIIVLVLCLVFACVDEYHQGFVSGRCSSLIDVAIDMIGASFACIAEYITIHFRKIVKIGKASL